MKDLPSNPSLFNDGENSASHLERRSDWPLGFDRNVVIARQYRLLDFLGEGGMGCVFKARDLRLNRMVALKFVKHLSQHANRRLVREARLQAQLDHDHICKVYEIGEVQGQTFIAMQYLEGVALSELVGDLCVEAKLSLMVKIALAVHKAHSLGFIHRDLKPGNVMVCQTEQGRLKPYILDFGLARRLQETHSTETGAMRGTWMFMAPEQVRGVNKEIDRRTDVFGLGASLFFLLCGKPPHESSGPAATLVAILAGETRSLRDYMPAIDKDVNLIVAKALAANPVDRYASCKALAEDIQRFLCGEPITAKKPNFATKLRLFFKRHKWWVRTVGFSMAAVFAVVIWSFFARKQLAQQAKVAAEFIKSSEELEAQQRFFAMLPPHSLQQDKTHLETMIGKVTQQMNVLGTVADGPGAYALGRGYLALNDYPKALRLLQKAWHASYQTDDVAISIGTVLQQLYLKELADIETLPDTDQRQKARAEKTKAYQIKARTYLNVISPQQSLANHHAAALIAFFEGKEDKALQHWDRLVQKQPVFYEGLLYQGQILMRRGDVYRDAEQVLAASEAYRLAEEKLRAAHAIGRSDPSTGLALTRLHLGRSMMTQSNPDESFDLAVATGADYAKQVLFLNREFAPANTMLAVFASMRATRNLHAGNDPMPDWQLALDYGQVSLAQDPNQPLVYNSVGMVHQIIGRYQLGRGGAPLPHFNQAIKVFQKGLALNPNSASLNNNLGLTLLYKAQVKGSLFEGDTSDMEAGIRHLQTAVRHMPNRLNTLQNVGMAYLTIAEAEYIRGRDPAENLCFANQVFADVLSIQPQHGAALLNQANVVQRQATYELEKGQSEPLELWKGLNLFHAASVALPNRPEIQNGYGLSFLNLGMRAWFDGGDPFPFLNQAVACFGDALRLRPQWDLALYNLGMVHRWIAEYRMLSGELAAQDWQTATGIFKELLQVNPAFSDAFIFLGDLALVAAQNAELFQTDAADWVNQARTYYQKAQTNDSGNAFLWFGLGKLHSIEARLDFEQASGGLATGLSYFEKALALRPDYHWFYRVYATTLVAQLQGKQGLSSTPDGLVEKAQALLGAAYFQQPNSAMASFLATALQSVILQHRSDPPRANPNLRLLILQNRELNQNEKMSLLFRISRIGQPRNLEITTTANKGAMP